MSLHVKSQVFILALLACSVSVVKSHPQCLDFRAPFKPDRKLKFCSEYSDLGCCGSADDKRVKAEYDSIGTLVDAIDWKLCQKYVKEILCQKCSPYAAHIYDAEGTSEARSFPGLCTDYCHGFHTQCKNLIPLLAMNLTVPDILNSKDRFCEEVALNDVLYCYPDLLTAPILLGNLTVVQNFSATPGCLCLETISDNLANPLWARHAGDGTGRLFVAEQKGRVRIYNTRNRKWNRSCFLDFTTKVEVSDYPGDERGFLGMAFHPQYATNGRFFVYYSTKSKPTDVLPSELKGRNLLFKTKIVISESRVLSTDPDRADPGYERIMLEVPQPYENHNGGELMFGVDGYLYAFIGDGGGAGDPMDAGQNKSLLHGKVIRIDVDSDPSKPYTIPRDNPFVREYGSRPEIYAYGIRNIWRCGLDKGDRLTGKSRGRIVCGDVGQNAYEEIDVLKKGANYGWNSREGFNCYNKELCGHIGQEELPIHAYSHKIGQSVTGGVFYRGCENPALNGQYIYGDYSSSRLFSLTESKGVWSNKNLNLCGPSLCQGKLLGMSYDHILSFGEDEEGEIYILTSKSTSSKKCDGKLHKIIDPIRRNDPSSCLSDPTRNKRVPMSQKQQTTRTDKVANKRSLPTITIKVLTWRKGENSSTASSFSKSEKLTNLNVPLDQHRNLLQQGNQQSSLLQRPSSRQKVNTSITAPEQDLNLAASDTDGGNSLSKTQILRKKSTGRKRSSGERQIPDSSLQDHHSSPMQTEKRRQSSGKKRNTKGNNKKPSTIANIVCNVCGD